MCPCAHSMVLFGTVTGKTTTGSVVSALRYDNNTWHSSLLFESAFIKDVNNATLLTVFTVYNIQGGPKKVYDVI